MLIEMMDSTIRDGGVLPDDMCAVNKDDLQSLITDYKRIEYALEESRINGDA
jgi:hypothetical protein